MKKKEKEKDRPCAAASIYYDTYVPLLYVATRTCVRVYDRLPPSYSSYYLLPAVTYSWAVQLLHAWTWKYTVVQCSALLLHCKILVNGYIGVAWTVVQCSALLQLNSGCKCVGSAHICIARVHLTYSIAAHLN